MLAGLDVRKMGARSYVDFIEAIVTEPAIHGGQDIDSILDQIEKQVLEANADVLRRMGRGEEVFDTPVYQKNAALIEQMYQPIMPGEVIDRPDPDEVEFDVGEVIVPDADAFKDSAF